MKRRSYDSPGTGCSAVWLARGVWDAEVAGSNPAIPTRFRLPESFAGSNPAAPTALDTSNDVREHRGSRDSPPTQTDLALSLPDTREPPAEEMNEKLFGVAVAFQRDRANLRSRVTAELGSVATEYGLILVLVALAFVAAAALFGAAVARLFDKALRGSPPPWRSQSRPAAGVPARPDAVGNRGDPCVSAGCGNVRR